MGVSAGANMACPTVATTNDMPPVHPDSLTLWIVPFQINITVRKISFHDGGSLKRTSENLGLRDIGVHRFTIPRIACGRLLHPLGWREGGHR